MAASQPFQPRELTEEQKAKLEKAEAEIDEAKEEFKYWSNEVKKALAGSDERKEALALAQQALFLARCDEAQAQLDKLKVEFGQVPGGLGAPKTTLASLPVSFRQNDYRRIEELSFCKPANFEDIVGNLIQVFDNAPGSGRMAVPLVIGASGIGKTRTVFEASLEALSRLNSTGAFARIFVNKIDEIEFSNVPIEKVIATLLAREFLDTPLQGDVVLDLPSLLKKLKDDLHITVLIVHIDEYQYNLVLAQRLVSQIVWLNRDNTHNIRCIPIVSGVPKVRLEKDLDATSSWQPNRCILQPVPGLSRIVYSRWNMLDDAQDPTFDSLLEACGGYPFLIWELVRVCEKNPPLLESLKSKTFGPNAAADIWNSLIHDVRWRFQRRLWLDVLSSEPTTAYIPNTAAELHHGREAADKRRSTALKDAIARTLLNFAVAEVVVDEDDHILPDASSLTFRQAAILFDLVRVPKGFLVYFPLVVAYIVNDEFNVVPGDLIRSNPFKSDPFKFETAATMALATRVTARRAKELIPLNELRPGAQMYVGDDVLRSMKVIVPEALQYVELVNHLTDRKGKSLPLSDEPGKTWSGTVGSGTFFVAATDQAAIDSFGLVDGLWKSQEHVPLELISQYKMLRSHEPSTGASSLSQLDDSDVLSITRAMQKMEGSVAEKLSLAKKKRIVVYDVFTSRLDGKEQGQAGYPKLLKQNEVLFVSNCKNAGEALGPVLGVREGISKRLKLKPA